MRHEWKRIEAQTRSAFGGVDWCAKDMLRRCDPVMVWFDVALQLPVAVPAGRKAAVADTSGDYRPTLLLELRDPDAWGDLLTKNILPTHLRCFYEQSRFVSCMVPYEEIPALVKSVSGTGPVSRLELCEPRVLAQDVSKLFRDLLQEQFRFNFDLKLNKTRPLESRRRLPLPTKQAIAQLATSEGRPPRRLDDLRRADQRGPVVCVVDDRVPFASPKLLMGDGPAVATMWHQGNGRRVKGLLDAAPSGAYSLAFGRDLGQNFRGALTGRLLQVHQLKGDDIDETSAYRRAAYPPVPARWSHGSAVAHMVAGATTAQGSCLLKPRALLFNQLPGLAYEDTLGVSLAAHVLDALHDALDMVELENRRKPQPVIANLSLGTHGGPHDGTSMFERALGELLDLNKGQRRVGEAGYAALLQVVLAAGNSHLLRAHAGDWLMPGRNTTLRWLVRADNPSDAMLQIWTDRPANLCITAKPPEGPISPPVRTDAALAWRSVAGATESVHAALVFPAEVAQGLRGSMALLAIAPTRRVDPEGVLHSDEDGRPVRRPGHGAHGVWEVELINCGPDSLRFDAWIQRDSPAPGRSAAESGRMPRHGYFVDATPDGADDVTTGVTHPDPRFTLNGIGTLVRPNQLWVVGAMRQCDQGLSTYSPAGPNRQTGERCEGVDLVAPADDSLALPGLLTRGMLGSSAVRVDGTSIAAAVVTRELYRHLSEGRTAESFAPLPVQTPTARPIRAAGEPQRADPILRGDQHRMPVSATHLISKQCGDDGTCG